MLVTVGHVNVAAFRIRKPNTVRAWIQKQLPLVIRKYFYQYLW
jgi:hypothetical protein